MRSITGAIALVGAVGVSTFGVSAGAWAHMSTRTQQCSSYKGGAGRLVDAFTRIDAQGVGCHRAHEVLGVWANSAPGGTDLGFSCKSTKGTAKNTLHVRCVDGSKRVTALDTQHTES